MPPCKLEPPALPPMPTPSDSWKHLSRSFSLYFATRSDPVIGKHHLSFRIRKSRELCAAKKKIKPTITLRNSRGKSWPGLDERTRPVCRACQRTRGLFGNLHFKRCIRVRELDVEHLVLAIEGRPGTCLRKRRGAGDRLQLLAVQFNRLRGTRLGMDFQQHRSCRRRVLSAQLRRLDGKSCIIIHRRNAFMQIDAALIVQADPVILIVFA